jgi:hypothetical protein
MQAVDIARRLEQLSVTFFTGTPADLPSDERQKAGADCRKIAKCLRYSRVADARLALRHMRHRRLLPANITRALSELSTEASPVPRRQSQPSQPEQR